MADETIFIAGPTAVGKSEVALVLAEQLTGEIISVDSMQVYRGMDIGTAKPSPAARARVAHHLLDILNPNQSFDAAQFVRQAQSAAGQIRARRRTAIFCGGTGLYFKAFLEGLGEAPPADAELRKILEKTPKEDLLKELKQRDRETFDKIDQRNLRRVIRAVEVIRLTGKPFSKQRATWERGGAATNEGALGQTRPTAGWFIALSRDRDDLRERINGRVEEMFRRGLVAETERLLKLNPNKVALQALGYRQVIEHLEGNRDLGDTIELVKLRTRQFARRQMTWFRGQRGIDWLQIGEGELIEETVTRIRSLIGKR